MIDKAELLQAIDALGSAPVSGTVFRHTAPGREPLSGEGARRFGGRWNPPGGEATIYVARPVECCIAEFFRMAEGQGRGAVSFLPRDIHVIELSAVGLVDLRDDDALGAVGLSASDVSAVTWTACQRVGEAIQILGYAGLVARSAAGMGEVIALFERRLDPSSVSVLETRSLGEFV